MLPKGWRRLCLRELVASLDAGVSVNGEDRPVESGEAGVLKISAVTSGKFDHSQNKAIRLAELARAAITPEADRIIMSRCNTEALVGASAYVERSYPNLYLSDKLWQIEPAKANSSDMRWLSYLLASQSTRAKLSKLSTGTSGSMKNITKEQVLGLEVPVPPLPEQSRIARVLSSWDQAICVTERLLSISRKQKLELVNTLMHGNRRLSAHVNRWKQENFDALFERVSRKNTVENINVLTISGEHGLICQRDYFKKSVASTNLSGYTLLLRGEFAYNKSYSTGYPMGAIKPLMLYEAGVVSSLYLCFRIRSDVDACPDFFRHYFEGGLFNREIEGIAQEGARNHGLLNVSVVDFFKLRLRVPSAPEQRDIARVINIAEAEEKIFAEQLRVLQVEKAGLMQQLLTGKRRVHLPAPDLERAA